MKKREEREAQQDLVGRYLNEKSSYVPRSTSLWVTCPECKAHMQSKPRLIATLTEEAKLQGKSMREVAITYFDTYHLAAHRYEPMDLDSGKDPW